jgi:hypothetical protein
MGLVTTALVMGPVGLVALRRRQLPDLAWGAAAVALIAGPWYLRNVISAGNPIYPAFFGGKYVTSGVRTVEAVGSSELSHPVLRLPFLPIDFFANHTAYAKGRYIGMAIFLLAPLGLFVPAPRLPRLLFAGVVVYTAVYLYLVPSQARYMLPALAVLAALGGYGAARLLRSREWAHKTLVVLLVLVAVTWIVPSAALTRQLIPVAFGAESRDHFLQRVTGVQKTFDAVAKRTDATIGFADFENIYNYPGPAISLGDPEFVKTLPRETFLARLRREGVGYVFTPEFDLTAPNPIPEGRFQRLYVAAQVIRPVWGCLRHVAVYEVDVVQSRSTGEKKRTQFGLMAVRPCETR